MLLPTSSRARALRGFVVNTANRLGSHAHTPPPPAGTLGFARTLASAWSVCLLDLFLRVQLNLLGSHVYLSAALKDPKSAAPSSPHSAARQNAPTPAAEGRPALSLSAQHAYLALHSHFIREGTAVLAPVLVAACRTALAECVAV